MFIKRLLSYSSISALSVVVICISEVIDISSDNLDSSFWLMQPGIWHDVLCGVDSLEKTPMLGGFGGRREGDDRG